MARITVEDCLEKIPNRFELVLIATRRARELAVNGKESFVNPENDKPTVIALREIAAGMKDKFNKQTVDLNGEEVMEEE